MLENIVEYTGTGSLGIFFIFILWMLRKKKILKEIITAVCDERESDRKEIEIGKGANRILQNDIAHIKKDLKSLFNAKRKKK